MRNIFLKLASACAVMAIACSGTLLSSEDSTILPWGKAEERSLNKEYGDTFKGGEMYIPGDSAGEPISVVRGIYNAERKAELDGGSSDIIIERE